VRTGFARAFSTDDEWKNRPLSNVLGLASPGAGTTSQEMPESHI
jgi:hypothetical protein